MLISKISKIILKNKKYYCNVFLNKTNILKNNRYYNSSIIQQNMMATSFFFFFSWILGSHKEAYIHNIWLFAGAELELLVRGGL